jgi:hypothetical protein
MVNQAAPACSATLAAKASVVGNASTPPATSKLTK